MHYKGDWSNGEVKVPVEFDVDERGAIYNFNPPALEEELYGAAYVAVVNWQNQFRKDAMRIPNSIEAYPANGTKLSV